jgi:phage tail tape-measure protein
MGVGAGQIINGAHDVVEMVDQSSDFVTNGLKVVGKIGAPLVKAAFSQAADFVGPSQAPTAIAEKAFKAAEGAGSVAEVVERAEVPLAIAIGTVKAGYEIYKGEYREASGTAVGTAVAIAAGIQGAEAGAAAGAAIGSVVPVLGTAVGAAVGGIVGGIVGGAVGYAAGHDVGQQAYDVVKEGAIGARGELSKVYNWFAGGNTSPQAAPAATQSVAVNNTSTQKINNSPRV